MFSVHCSAKDEQFHSRVTLNLVIFAPPVDTLCADLAGRFRPQLSNERVTRNRVPTSTALISELRTCAVSEICLWSVPAKRPARIQASGTNSRRSASHPNRNSPPFVGTSFPRCIQQPERPQVSALQLTPQGKRLGSRSEAIDFRAKFRDWPHQFSAHLFILTCIRSTIDLALLILDFMDTILPPSPHRHP